MAIIMFQCFSLIGKLQQNINFLKGWEELELRAKKEIKTIFQTFY